MQVWVDPSGTVTKVRVIQRSGYPELDILAKQAARQWIFAKLDPNLPQKEQFGYITIRYRLVN
jgi:TonB family protein